MDTASSPYSKIILSVIIIGLLTASAMLWAKYQWLRVRVAFAEEQIELFEDMRNRALEAEPAKAVGYLDYASGYYPSGTKQEEDTRLDRIVEQARASAVRDIIRDLRIKTGEDLGDDPAAWVTKYAVKTK